MNDLLHAKGTLEFVFEYYSRYKAVPVDTTIRSQGTDWSPLEGELEYWLDEFRKVTIARKAQSLMLDAINNFSDPERAVANLIQNLSAIRVTGSTKIGATDREIAQRLERYKLRKDVYLDTSGQQVWGIESGFKPINATGIGWMPGELIGIIARPSVGKTWVLSREAALAWFQGLRILFISPEMPRSQIALRFDVIKAHHLGIRLSHRMTYIGHPAMEGPYEKLAEQVQTQERWWTIDSDEEGAFSVRKVDGYIAQFNPDVVCIDGASLLQSTKRDEWQAMKENMYGLKQLATTAAIPFIVTHQTSRKGRGTKEQAEQAAGKSDDWTMPTLNDAAFGDAFVQACSTVIAMCSDRYRDDVRWYSIRKTRDRDAITTPRFGMYVDFDHGQIEDLSQHLTPDDVLAAVARLSGQTA